MSCQGYDRCSVCRLVEVTYIFQDFSGPLATPSDIISPITDPESDWCIMSYIASLHIVVMRCLPCVLLLCFFCYDVTWKNSLAYVFFFWQ